VRGTSRANQSRGIRWYVSRKTWLLDSDGGLELSNMSLSELEQEVKRLSPEQLAKFAVWMDEFTSQNWDKQLEADIAGGKLDHLAREADEDFKKGRCTEL
jgi:hypothetical protein